jgi:L-threonylcarbamoyladenylate synthase
MHIKKADRKNIEEVVALLQSGGVIIYPTETVYGIGCLAGNAEGIARIEAIKRSPRDAAYLILIRDANQMSKYAARIPEPAKRLAKRFWPGPLTLALPAKAGLHPRLVGPSGGVALRVSSNSWCRALMEQLNDALVSTSANPSGYPPPASLMELDQQVGAAVDLVIDGGILTGELSTLVDLTGDAPKLIREGAVKRDVITATFSNPAART